MLSVKIGAKRGANTMGAGTETGWVVGRGDATGAPEIATRQKSAVTLKTKLRSGAGAERSKWCMAACNSLGDSATNTVVRGFRWKLAETVNFIAYFQPKQR